MVTISVTLLILSLVSIYFFRVVSLSTNALFHSIKSISKTVLEIIPSQATNSLIQYSKHFIVVVKLNSTQLIFQFWEQKEVAWTQVRRIRRIWIGFNMILELKFMCYPNSMEYGVIVVKNKIVNTDV